MKTKNEKKIRGLNNQRLRLIKKAQSLETDAAVLMAKANVFRAKSDQLYYEIEKEEK